MTVSRLRLICLETGAVLFESEREVQERPWPDRRPWPKRHRVRAPERGLEYVPDLEGEGEQGGGDFGLVVESGSDPHPVGSMRP